MGRAVAGTVSAILAELLANFITQMQKYLMDRVLREYRRTAHPIFKLTYHPIYQMSVIGILDPHYGGANTHTEKMSVNCMRQD